MCVLIARIQLVGRLEVRLDGFEVSARRGDASPNPTRLHPRVDVPGVDTRHFLVDGQCLAFGPPRPSQHGRFEGQAGNQLRARVPVVVQAALLDDRVGLPQHVQRELQESHAVLVTVVLQLHTRELAVCPRQLQPGLDAEGHRLEWRDREVHVSFDGSRVHADGVVEPARGLVTGADVVERLRIRGLRLDSHFVLSDR